MKVNKITIKPNKILIDLILCPKTLLYLQDLYCRRCSYYELDSEKHVECNFTGHRYGKPDPIKDRIIQDLSTSFITELPIEKNTNNDNGRKTVSKISQNSKSLNSFTERLHDSKSRKTKNELENNDLSQYLKKTNLTTRLENIKKDPSEKE
ncbi:MAG: hypothetical protein JSV62_09205 [Promethearchaeota archaeon]|nr:MAG: hypothetical protein JSV62_09205 [Candidatus Lokiarchaeota archaeon]